MTEEAKFEAFASMCKKVAELDKENAELKADNDARKFAMAMSEIVEKQLREENAELKEQNRKLLESCEGATMMYEQLIKTKELLFELYDCIPSSMADCCKETLQKVALVFKDSEVSE